MKSKVQSANVIEGSIEWVNNLIDKVLGNLKDHKQYFIAPKKWKKKKYLYKSLNVKKVKHKFADTNFEQSLK
jgi:hypothetical protein